MRRALQWRLKVKKPNYVSNGCPLGVASSCSNCHHHTLQHFVVAFASATCTPSCVAVAKKVCWITGETYTRVEHQQWSTITVKVLSCGYSKSIDHGCNRYSCVWHYECSNCTINYDKNIYIILCSFKFMQTFALSVAC